MQASFEIDRLKFPIGPFVKQESYSQEELKSLITIIETAPSRYREVVRQLSSADMTKTYREGSWDIRQLLHHVADMQLLHFLRMKRALTEPDYKEVTLVNIDGWAQTVDATAAPVEDSLVMFEGITKRFVCLLRSLDNQALEIAYFHPVRKIMISQAAAIAMTAWHVQHHLEHIKIASGIK